MSSKYKFENYNSKYKKQYNYEYRKLMPLLENYNTQIAHIGSTAIPGLGGKGVIDIIIKIKKTDLKKTLNILTKNKYELRSKNEDQERFFLLKKYVTKSSERYVHVHLTTDLKEFEKVIKFRDYLINNKDKCKEYVLVKKNAVKHCKGDGHLYQKLKHKFISDIMKDIR